MPLRDKLVTYCQNFDFKIKRDHQNISYDDKEPILDYVPKNDKKRIQAVKGWRKWKLNNF